MGKKTPAQNRSACGKTVTEKHRKVKKKVSQITLQ